MRRRHLLRCTPALLLAGCAGLPHADPVRVQLVDLDPAESESLEVRFIAKLRVINPNDSPIDFRGVAVDITVRGNAFAAGAADTPGTVPAFGEALVALPVSVSALNVARTAIGFFLDDGSKRLDYVLKGKLGGGMMPLRFESRGEIDFLPGGGVSIPPSAP